jgi:hypothetical protein
VKGVRFAPLSRSQPGLANEWHGVCPLNGRERSRRQVGMSEQGIIAASTGFDRQTQTLQRKMLVVDLLITVMFAGAAFAGLWLIR